MLGKHCHLLDFFRNGNQSLVGLAQIDSESNSKLPQRAQNGSHYTKTKPNRTASKIIIQKAMASRWKCLQYNLAFEFLFCDWKTLADKKLM